VKYDRIIAIDPGLEGGIVVLVNGELRCKKMPVNIILRKKDGKLVLTKNKKPSYRKETDILAVKQILQEQSHLCNPLLLIEKLMIFDKADSDQEAPGKKYRIQMMLANYEALKTLIIIAGIPMVEVAPISWQSYLNLRRKGQDRNDRKALFVEMAGRYFPEMKSNLWNSDAACIAEFGRRKLAHDPRWIQERVKYSPNNQLI